MTFRAAPSVAGLLLAALTLTFAGCGSPNAPTDQTSTSVGSTATATPTGEPSVSSSPTDSVGGSTTLPSAQVPGGVVELTGVVENGVEAGCVVLLDANGGVVANLMGLDLTAHPVGSRVQVTGSFAMDVMTTCQQGRPFEVTDVVAE